MQVFIFCPFEFMFLPQCLVTVLVNSLLCIVCAIYNYDGFFRIYKSTPNNIRQAERHKIQPNSVIKKLNISVSCSLSEMILQSKQVRIEFPEERQCTHSYRVSPDKDIAIVGGRAKTQNRGGKKAKKMQVGVEKYFFLNFPLFIYIKRYQKKLTP